MTIAFIGLGSNLGQPEQQIAQALRALSSLPRSRLLNASSLYRSAPLNDMPQPDYVNAVAQIDTALSPLDLLHALQTIEQAQGRERTQRWDARTLDLDILLFGSLQQCDAQLTLPHPGLTQREFVVFPLLEIAADLVLPDGQALQQFAAALSHRPLQRISA